MKKVITMIAMGMGLLTAVPMQAQNVNFGIKGGYNITNIKVDKESTANSLYEMGKENKNGWFIGPSVKVSFAGGLGVDGAVLYDQRKLEIEGESVKMQYVNIPINLRYNIGLGGLAGIYLAAGPQFGFNVGDKDLTLKNVVNNTSGVKENVNDTFQMKKATFGINLGVGVYALKHLEVGFAYNIPLGNTADFDRNIISSTKGAVEKYDVKANTWQVSAAIYF